MTETFRAVLLPLWPAAAAALVVGLPFGWLGWRERAPGFLGRLGLILAFIALGGGTALAILGRVPGRPGLWLEIGLVVLLAYLVGCILGSTVRGAWLRSIARQPASPEA